jgi:hypothetical protein
MTDDEDASYRPNCVMNDVFDTIGAAKTFGRIATLPQQPVLGTNDFTVEVWIKELATDGFDHYTYWNGGYVAPPWAGTVRADANFTRISPFVEFNWQFGAGDNRNIYLGLNHYEDDMYLAFSEWTQAGPGVQTFWGAAVARPAYGSWTHYALVCERSNDEARLYLNGILADTLNIAGHRNYDHQVGLSTYGIVNHGIYNQSGTTYMNAPCRGVYSNVWFSPSYKYNLFTLHYEALTPAEVKNSFVGKTTQNSSNTYSRYDWRDLQKGMYTVNPKWVRRYRDIYDPYAAGIPGTVCPDSWLSYLRDTPLGQGRSYGCQEIRAITSWNSVCCDSSMWGKGVGNAEIFSHTLQVDDDPFWRI